jgi:hypothetical protein
VSLFFARARYAFVYVLKNRVRTEGTENTEDKLTRGRALPEKKRHAGLKSGVLRRSKAGIARLRGLPKSARWLPRDDLIRASRRKRSFFSRRRDTGFVQAEREA